MVVRYQMSLYLNARLILYRIIAHAILIAFEKIAVRDSTGFYAFSRAIRTRRLLNYKSITQ